MSDEVKDKIRKELDSNIPQDAVETRSQGGRDLSYLSGAYVIDRLNQVLGQGNWQYETESLTKVYEGEIEQYSGKAFTTSYIAVVRLKALVGGYAGSVEFSDVGYGDGTDKKSAGKAHELAVKEAVTDAVKRCAKNLGRSMGLGLYFKEGQYVGETGNAMDRDSKHKTEEISGVGNSSNVGRCQRSSAAGGKSTSKALKGQIKSAFAVLQDQKKITKEVFQAEYTKGTKVDDLDDVTVNLVITKLKTTFPELGL